MKEQLTHRETDGERGEKKEGGEMEKEKGRGGDRVQSKMR